VLEYMWRACTLGFDCLQLPEKGAVGGLLVDKGWMCIVEVEWAQIRVCVLVADLDRQEVDLFEILAKMEAWEKGDREFGVQFGQSWLVIVQLPVAGKSDIAFATTGGLFCVFGCRACAQRLHQWHRALHDLPHTPRRAQRPRQLSCRLLVQQGPR
jgi:hypothetical protein